MFGARKGEGRIGWGGRGGGGEERGREDEGRVRRSDLSIVFVFVFIPGLVVAKPAINILAFCKFL